MRWIRETVARHPLVVDIGVVVLLLLMALPVAGNQISGLELLLTVALFVPLAWRRRAPVVVFWLTFGATELTWRLNIVHDVVFLAMLVAAYALARYRRRKFLWPACAGMLISIVVGALEDEEFLPALIMPLGMVSCVVLLGAYVQTRRAYLDGLIERAKRLEREHDQQARLAVAAERSRIAREMHDIVAHNLAVMVALAEGASTVAKRGAPEQAADAMNKVSETGRQALGEMRRLLAVLKDDKAPGDNPGPQPGFADLDELVSHVRTAGVDVTLTVDGGRGDWGPGVGLAAFRIVQEALTNTLKHSGPGARVAVRLSYSPSGVEIDVTDDGARRWSALPTKPAGQGIPGMVERAASFGGDLEAGPRGNVPGWRVTAHLSAGDHAPLELTA